MSALMVLRKSFAVGACLLGALAQAQLRVATYNITNYDGGRAADLEKILYGTYQGRSLSADILACQEFLTSAALSEFVTILNSAPGSPGDWTAAPFINGPDTESVCAYRTSKLTFLGVSTISTGGSNADQPPRNTYRYDFRVNGYIAASATVAIYVSHMKAGSLDTDQVRRLIEAERIRANAETLPTSWNFIIAADLNIQDAAQAAYVELVGSQPNNNGRFFDPISSSGEWNNNSAFRFVHTQDPASQMDDRFDQILLSSSLIDGLGFDYIGNPQVPFSTTTWNDPNHSYRAWGNDGTSYNQPLKTTGNTMVGPTIAQSLINVAQGNGHIPAFLDLKVPPKASATAALNFGLVPVNALVQRTLTVSNVGDTALWTTNGIASLNYSITSAAKFTTPAGPFNEAPGGGSNAHTVTLDTSKPGRFRQNITIQTNDPDKPVLTVACVGFVVGPSGPG